MSDCTCDPACPDETFTAAPDVAYTVTKREPSLADPTDPEVHYEGEHA